MCDRRAERDAAGPAREALLQAVARDSPLHASAAWYRRWVTLDQA